MCDKARYMMSREAALFFMWDIKSTLPNLRESHLVPREVRHSTMDVDRHFGKLKRIIANAAKKAPVKNRGWIANVIRKHNRNNHINAGTNESIL